MDLAFYNVGCERTTVNRHLMVGPRRAFRRVMRPMLYRLQDILGNLVRRHDQSDQNILTLHTEFLALRSEVLNLRAHVPILYHEIAALRGQVGTLTGSYETVSGQARTAIAMAWDEAAVVRRLAVIEEHIESLLPPNTRAQAQDEVIPAIAFPGLRRERTSVHGKVAGSS